MKKRFNLLMFLWLSVTTRKLIIEHNRGKSKGASSRRSSRTPACVLMVGMLPFMYDFDKLSVHMYIVIQHH